MKQFKENEAISITNKKQLNYHLHAAAAAAAAPAIAAADMETSWEVGVKLGSSLEACVGLVDVLIDGVTDG